jgi:hypothetical protein
LDNIVPTFVNNYVADDTTTVPISVTLKFKFTTYDPTLTDKVIEDIVKVTIHSNGDHGQCADATYAFDDTTQDLAADGPIQVILPIGATAPVSVV